MALECSTYLKYIVKTFYPKCLEQNDCANHVIQESTALQSSGLTGASFCQIHFICLIRYYLDKVGYVLDCHNI